MNNVTSRDEAQFNRFRDANYNTIRIFITQPFVHSGLLCSLIGKRDQLYKKINFRTAEQA